MVGILQHKKDGEPNHELQSTMKTIGRYTETRPTDPPTQKKSVAPAACDAPNPKVSPVSVNKSLTMCGDPDHGDLEP